MEQILWDFSPVDTIQIVAESKTSGEMIIRGIFGRANEVNNNKRIYPKQILEREVSKLQPLINEKRLLGELEHPERVNVSLTNASHLITGLSWNGNVLMGEAKILNTPAGKIAQQLIKDGVKLGVSSRGTGSLKESQTHPGVSEVTDSYKMLTFDLVADPSTRGAFPGLVSESTKIAMEKSKKEVATQNLLTKLFEEKLSVVKEERIKNLFEGRSTGGDPIATGKRVGKYLKSLRSDVKNYNNNSSTKIHLANKNQAKIDPLAFHRSKANRYTNPLSDDDAVRNDSDPVQQRLERRAEKKASKEGNPREAQRDAHARITKAKERAGSLYKGAKWSQVEEGTVSEGSLGSRRLKRKIKSNKVDYSDKFASIKNTQTKRELRKKDDPDPRGKFGNDFRADVKAGKRKRFDPLG
jgi:hypothetical protein